MRNPVSLEKLTLGENGVIYYRAKSVNPNHAANFRIFSDPLEFIAEVVQHVPPQNFQIARYYGYYSNLARGKHFFLIGSV